MDHTVQDTIDDMTRWLDEYRNSVSLAGAWDRVEEWRDELVRATGGGTP